MTRKMLRQMDRKERKRKREEEGMEVGAVLEGQKLGERIVDGDLMRNGVPVNEEIFRG